MAEQKKTDEPIQGLVIYSDGGCRPTNPGPGGWGIHGYLFRAEKPKKGTGNQTHVLTSSGYVPKTAFNAKEKDVYTQEEFKKHVMDCLHERSRKVFEITPLQYVDGSGSFATAVSNNVAEIVAATRALTYAAEHNVQMVQIYTDSEYVCKGVKEWMPSWKRNNWIKSDGNPVANVDYWKELSFAIQQLEARGATIAVLWVRGHDGDLGNEIVDRYATIGVTISQSCIAAGRPETRNEITTSPSDGYWKYDNERHPFICHSWLYFNTFPGANVPGMYYLGQQGKPTEFTGTRLSNGAYAYVEVNKPDDVLEMLRDHHTKLADGLNKIIFAHLDQVYEKQTHRNLSMFGTNATRQNRRDRHDLVTTDNPPEPLTREMNPPHLAMRAVDSVTMLANLLQEYRDGDKRLVKTDLTPILYEVITKTVAKKEVSNYALRPEFTVGYAALEVQANFQSGDETSQAPVILTLGIDIPDRNTLKRIEGMKPKVTLISWLDSPTVFRYATVIETEDAAGVWCGIYSNMRFLTP